MNDSASLMAEETPVTHRTIKSLPSISFDSVYDITPSDSPVATLEATTPLPDISEMVRKSADPPATTDSDFVLRNREMAWNNSTNTNSPEYVLKRELGAGGMGTVYEAEQASVGRTVAIKVLKPELASITHAVKSFTAEGTVTAELEHPCIVPLYDLGHSDLTGAPFIAMKQIRGKPWTKVIDEQTNHQLVDVLLRVSDAVAFAHSRGVVHRDLKPDNVMLGGFGEVLVMDWGLAVFVPVVQELPSEYPVRPRAQLVTDSTFGGTPAYMAPELTGPDLTKIGTRSDVYLLGAVLWRGLTGRAPHVAENLPECIRNARNNIIADPPEGIASVCDEVGTTELIAVARKAMATDPDDRYQTVIDFQDALRAWQTHAQSAVLTRRAATLLGKVHNGGSSNPYQSYAMAMYSYEEALSLWPENPCAKEGLRTARLAGARFALRRGDLELADSLLAQSGGDTAEPELAKEIADARKQRACSEHHRATLARTAEKWSLAFEISPDPMIILRKEDAVVLEANANFEKVTGWPRDEVIGKSTAQINLWANTGDRAEFITRLEETGEVQGYMAKFRRRSGEEYEVLVSAVIAEFDGVQVVVANSRDVSHIQC